ncbi:MAG TPA: thiol peroxidase, partial [Sporomusaceae bacterium]|nr:thiol peroxidase [Sporomusaceae bacterium]
MQKRTGLVKFGNTPVTLLGNEIKVGDTAPNFTVLTPELSPASLDDYKGSIRIISVVPSIDTSVCDMQTRWFNQDATQIEGVVILTISVDLPFALKRYCGANEITNVKTLSDHKDLDFGLKYGFVMEELRLLARGVIVIDQQDVVRYVQYVPEIKDQ